jgi:hypothetical protein
MIAKQNKLIFLFLLVSSFCISQDTQIDDLICGIYVNHPPRAIAKEKLLVADSLVHLDKNYKSDWIKEFISVEISAYNNGVLRKVRSENDLLNQEQKELLSKVDDDKEIYVRVDYMPNNKLSYNEPKEHSFSLGIKPEVESKFPGGQQALDQYLQENVLDKISDIPLKQYQMEAVTFVVDKEGYVINPKTVNWPSDDERINDILMKAVCNMPRWIPANHANGIKVKQELVLTLGDANSCIMNLINIEKN